jgi:GGDEF domain-containing protein
LPAGRLIEEQLRRIIRQQNWAYMDVRINYFEPFKETYGFVAGDDVLRFTAMLIGEVLDELGTANDFIGHAGGDSFVIITAAEVVLAIKERLKRRFVDEVLSHYSFLDREQGFIRTTNKDGQVEQAPLMKLSIGVVTPVEYQFADIREITELAAEARRRSG